MKRRFYAASAGLVLYTTCGSVRAVTPPAPAPPPAADSRSAAANVERDWSTLPKDAPTGGFPRTPYVSVFYIGVAAGPTSTKGHAPMRAGFAVEATLGAAFWQEIPLNIGVGITNLGDPLVKPGNFEPCDVAGTCPTWHDSSSRIVGNHFTINTGYQHRFQASDVVYFVPGLLLGYQASVNQPHTSCADCPDQPSPVPDASLSGMYLAPAVRASFGSNGGFIAVSVRSQWFLTGDLLQTTLFGVEFIAP